MRNNNKESLGFGFVQFKKHHDAVRAIDNLKDASINGIPVILSLFGEAKKTDPDKQFLYEKNEKRFFKSRKVDFDTPIEQIQKSIQLLNQLKLKDEFTFLIDDKSFKINKSLLLLISPQLSKRIQNDHNFSSFKINLKIFFNDFYHFNDLFSFILSYQKDLSKSQLQTKLLKNFNIIKFGELDQFIKISEKCGDFLFEGKNQLGLDFIILIQLFVIVFENKIISDKLFEIFIQKVKENITKKSIKDQELLIPRLVLKYILMNEYKMKFDFDDEVNYIIENFYEIDRSILNEIDTKIIERSITSLLFDSKSEDLFFYKILTLKEEHTRYFIHFVDFKKISNEAMKFFLDSFKLSDFDEQLLGSISIRFSFKLMNEFETKSSFEIEKSKSLFLDFALDEINKSYQNDGFAFFVNDKKIECNMIVVTFISPLVESNFYADAMSLSFSFDLQVDSFVKLFEYLYFFATSKTVDIQFSMEKIENKTIEYLTEIIDNSNKYELNKYILDKIDSFNGIQFKMNEQVKEIISDFVIFIEVFI